MALTVIGAGFGRTGTMSLRDALNMIGFGPCYHMSEVVRNPALAAHWAKLARGERVDWEAVFKGYRSTMDWPGCTYWRELAARYPEAKVILTLRDPDRWFDSTRNTIFSDEHLARFSGADADPNFRDMIRRVYDDTFDGKGHIREHAIAVFNAHNEAVQQAIPADRLLVYRVAEGWEPLCEFLGVPVPAEPFPNINTTQEWRDRPPPQPD